MKVTVLGNRSPFPSKEGACPSYLLQTEEQNIIIDLGPGSLQNLNRYIDFSEITAVVISHLHADHFLDLLPLRYAIMLDIINGKREDALAVYMPFENCKELEFIRASIGEEYHLQEIKEDTNLQLNGINITFKKTEHPKECYAMRIKQGERILGYSADTAWSEEVIQFLTNTDLLMIEASLLEKDNDKVKMGHLTVKEAVEFGDKSGAKRVVLTHFGSLYSEESIMEEIGDTFNNVEASNINNEYFI